MNRAVEPALRSALEQLEQKAREGHAKSRVMLEVGEIEDPRERGDALPERFFVPSILQALQNRLAKLAGRGS